MDDTVKGLTIGLVTMLFLHGSLHSRARHAAERQMRESFTNAGSIYAVVREQAPFGLFANDLRAIDIYGNHVVADSLPFVQIPRDGWKGRIAHLRLHLTDATIAGMQIGRLDADVPRVTYDLGYAFYRDRLLIRSASEGQITVRIDQSKLAAFVEHKYNHMLTNVDVALTEDRLNLTGKMSLFGSTNSIAVNGLVTARSGRYLDLTNATIMMNGSAMDPSSAQTLLTRINPVLDVEKDLHLGKVIRIISAYGRDHQLVIQGTVSLPNANLGAIPTPEGRKAAELPRE